VSSFQQAAIQVEKQREFEELSGTISRVFAPERVERFLKQVRGRIRDFDSLLVNRTFERVDEPLAKSGRSAKQLYEALTLSDQSQMREFYLSKLETVDTALRHKFKKVFQYY
jgi:hypothetical protein